MPHWAAVAVQKRPFRVVQKAVPDFFVALLQPKKWPPFLGAIYCENPHKYLVPANGFELLTFALQVRCSTN
tara:strand:- start:19410 stop:19622 length:213 start_codon:yes stop_codon:yes gene_type:complete